MALLVIGLDLNIITLEPTRTHFSIDIIIGFRAHCTAVFPTCYLTMYLTNIHSCRNYTYHPNMEYVSGNIVKDSLSLPTSVPHLVLPSALLGCSLQDNQTCNPSSCIEGAPRGFFGGLDRSFSSIISQVGSNNAEYYMLTNHNYDHLDRSISQKYF